jgi:hypothetical protein
MRYRVDYVRLPGGNVPFISLYFYSAGAMIIFTHGFVKKTQKTPPEEIKKALRYRSWHNPS